MQNWSDMGANIKGDAYEGSLKKNAQDIKNGGRAVLHAAPVDSVDGGLHGAPVV